MVSPVKPYLEVRLFLCSVDQIKLEPAEGLSVNKVQIFTHYWTLKKMKLEVSIIFCTAHNEYTLHAFDGNGIDYILKPFDKKLAVKSIEKFKKLCG